LYSRKYLQQLKEIHSDKSLRTGFGGKNKHLGKFPKFMDSWNVKSLLDYGCGKGHILAQLKESYPGVSIQGYDPALELFASLSSSNYDCVFSNDVLEHIEPEYIGQVLDHINTLSTKYIWLRIDTLPARKKLSDGRNAHLILETPQWWLEKIKTYIDGTVQYHELTKKGKFDIAIEK